MFARRHLERHQALGIGRDDVDPLPIYGGLPARKVKGQVAGLEGSRRLDDDACSVWAILGFDQSGSRGKRGLVKTPDTFAGRILGFQRRPGGALLDVYGEKGPRRGETHSARTMFVGKEVVDGGVGFLGAVSAERIGVGDGRQDQ